MRGRNPRTGAGDNSPRFYAGKHDVWEFQDPPPVGKRRAVDVHCIRHSLYREVADLFLEGRVATVLRVDAQRLRLRHYVSPL